MLSHVIQASQMVTDSNWQRRTDAADQASGKGRRRLQYAIRAIATYPIQARFGGNGLVGLDRVSKAVFLGYGWDNDMSAILVHS